MSSNPQGGPATPLVGVDFDSDVVSRPRDPYQGRKKKKEAFLKPYVEVTSVPAHSVVNYQLPKYKAKVVHVRPWEAPEAKSPRGIEPGTRVPKSYNKSGQSHSPVGGPAEQHEQFFRIDGSGPSEQGHNTEQAFRISGPGPSEQGHHKEQAFKISGPDPSEQGHNIEQAFRISGPGPSEQGYNTEQTFRISGPGPSEQGHKEQAFQISVPDPSEDGHHKEQAFKISGPDPSEQGHNKQQALKISGPGPSEQGHHKEQAFKISGPGLTEQGHNIEQTFRIIGLGPSEQTHEERAFKISGPLPFEEYDFAGETYSGEDESDYEFYDEEYYDEQPLDEDYPRFLDQSPYRDIFTHSTSSRERYRPFDITRDDFFRDDHPSRRYPPPPPPPHLRRDEDAPPPGIKKIISHIRRNVHDQVVKEPEITSLLREPLPSRSLEDQRDDYPDNIQEIKEIIKDPKYPLDYYRSGIPARGDHKSLHRQRGPPFRFP